MTFPMLRFNTQSSNHLTPSKVLTFVDKTSETYSGAFEGGIGPIHDFVAYSIPDKSSSCPDIEVGEYYYFSLMN